MEPFDPNRSRNRKPTFSSTERFLGVPSHAPPLENPTSPSSSSEELDEDDVVFFSDDYTEPNHPSSTTSSSSSSTPNHHHHKGFGFGQPDSFGILAALPKNAPNGNHFFHKASVSVSVSLSSSSSSSRSIPALPKPPPLLHDRTPSSSVKYHQSAPVNVPVLSPKTMKAARGRDDDDDGDDDAAEEEEMVPPHEMVARNSPLVSCSVLEGMGRTLKGRDLRRVRNAVWRQTGFLD